MVATLLEAAKAIASRIIAACTAKTGDKLAYNDESRAAVLTPLHKDGAPCWRSKDDSGTDRDAVVRVYASANENGMFTVAIGAHVPNVARSRKELANVQNLTAEQAEKVIAATVYRLMSADFTNGLAKEVPAAPVMRKAYVVRPDQLTKGKGKATAKTLSVDTLTLDLPDDKPQAAKPQGKA